MEPQLFKILDELEQKGEGAALVTVVESGGSTPAKPGFKMVVAHDRRTWGTVGGALLEKQAIDEALVRIKTQEPGIMSFVLREDHSGMMCGGEIRLFIDPLKLKPRIVFFGAGHVAQALYRSAGTLGFRALVVDDRGDFANAGLFPGAEIAVADFEDFAHSFEPASMDFIVIMTYEHKKDLEVLLKLISKKWTYLGVIASRRKWEKFRTTMLQAGIDEHVIDRVKSPVGVPIGAVTPDEIGISILAEIIKTYRES